MIKYRGTMEDKVYGCFYTEYDLLKENDDRDQHDPFIRFLQMVKDSPLGIDLCCVTEDVERDMKGTSGSYTLDSLIDNYRAILSSASRAGDLYFSLHYAGSRKGVIFLYPRQRTENLYVMTKEGYTAIEEILPVEVIHNEP